MGRTGRIFGLDHWGVVPDILCLGKALGGGVMPLSAFMSTPRIWKVLEPNPFIHSSTFGGNPLACAAGIAAINVMLEEDLAGQAARSGYYLLERLREIGTRYPELVVEVRGKGLLLGVEFRDTEIGYAVAAGLFRRAVLVAGTLLNAKTIRIEPALNIPIELQDVVLSRLDETLTELMRSPRFVRRNGTGKRHVKKPAAGVVSFGSRRASVVSPRSKATVPAARRLPVSSLRSSRG